MFSLLLLIFIKIKNKKIITIKNRIEKNRLCLKNNPTRKVRDNNTKINIRNSFASRFKLFLLSQILTL